MKKLLFCLLSLFSLCSFAQTTVTYDVTNPKEFPGALYNDGQIYTIRNVGGVGTDFLADGSVHGYIRAITGYTICAGRGCASHPYTTLWAVQWAGYASVRTVLNWCTKTVPPYWNVTLYNQDPSLWNVTPTNPNPACVFPVGLNEGVIINVVGSSSGNLPALGLYNYDLLQVSPDGTQLLGKINGTPFLTTIAP